MQEFILGLTALIAAQTTYLTYKNINTSRRSLSGAMLCDTSALIDGRLMAVARSGFLSDELIITKSVLRELQLLADKADHEKRERARFGLDVVRELQAMPNISVTVLDDGTVPGDKVDEQLIALAKQRGAKLCTTDYNLNKVARAEDIVVTNVNELAHAIRSVYLPGERMNVTIVAKGQGRDQGIGYLDDGTMVVVDSAKQQIDRKVLVEVTRMLQTEAGRMLFAKMISSSKPTSGSQGRINKRSSKNSPKTGSRPQNRHKTPEDKLVELVNSDKI